jgi:hypothetical protein
MGPLLSKLASMASLEELEIDLRMIHPADAGKLGSALRNMNLVSLETDAEYTLPALSYAIADALKS